MNDGIPQGFKAGFVNIIGRPNAGKSTLMNALVGERMSIITHKPQTTRHRIIGILSGENFQIVFSDTPGYVKAPSYQMHKAMNRFVEGTVEDADLMLFVFDLTEELEADNPIIEVLNKTDAPKLLVLNKTDLVAPQRIQDATGWWKKRVTFDEVIAVSALKAFNSGEMLEKLLKYLPEGEAFYPPDQLTDRPERFFVSEIIREKILRLYEDEIPYSSEVVIEDFKESKTSAGEDIARIRATIFVMRETQKAIILGKGGAAIKKLGTYARQDIEAFLQTKAFIELTVKVRDNWRDDEKALQRFGYV
ncbi:MAG: GTPase Era [Saprospiraceae bacterium]|nr:GTPase Era [Saprospiraceae bacterium]